MYIIWLHVCTMYVVVHMCMLVLMVIIRVVLYWKPNNKLQCI